jgi:hypothetical protein
MFVITLSRTAKPQEMFRLISLCHIVIRTQAYKAQNGLTQCYYCQQFGHIWAKLKHLPPVVCGVVGATCTRSARERKRLFNTNMLQLPVGGKGESLPLQLPGLQARKEELQKRK